MWMLMWLFSDIQNQCWNREIHHNMDIVQYAGTIISVSSVDGFIVGAGANQ